MWLYVGNLAYGASGADLRSLFSRYGAVDSAFVARELRTGRSKDYGFVSLFDPKVGSAAITALNGHDVAGRTLAVGPAAAPPDLARYGASR